MSHIKNAWTPPNHINGMGIIMIQRHDNQNGATLLYKPNLGAMSFSKAGVKLEPPKPVTTQKLKDKLGEMGIVPFNKVYLIRLHDQNSYYISFWFTQI